MTQGSTKSHRPHVNMNSELLPKPRFCWNWVGPFRCRPRWSLSRWWRSHKCRLRPGLQRHNKRWEACYDLLWFAIRYWLWPLCFVFLYRMATLNRSAVLCQELLKEVPRPEALLEVLWNAKWNSWEAQRHIDGMLCFSSLSLSLCFLDFLSLSLSLSLSSSSFSFFPSF